MNQRAVVKLTELLGSARACAAPGSNQMLLPGYVEDVLGEVIGLLQPKPAAQMTPAERRARYTSLHEQLDLTIASFFLNNPTARPSTTPLIDLMRWVYAQTIDAPQAQKTETP